MNVFVRIAVVVIPIVAIGGYWALWGSGPAIDDTVVPVSLEAQGVPQQSRELVGNVAQNDESPIRELNDRRSDLTAEETDAAPATSSLPPLLPTAQDLNHSDTQVLDIFLQMSPQLSQWLVPDELVRKWVLAIDLMAAEKLPQRHRPLSYPASIFSVQKINEVDNKERFRALSQNDQRYSELVNTVVAIDPRTVGRYYREWQPLLERAYGELGKAGDFNARMTLAIANVLSVEASPSSAELTQPHVLYEYVEPALESRSSLEKAVWRLGEENRLALQAYLRELKFYL